MAVGTATSGRLLDYEQYIEYQLRCTQSRIKATEILIACLVLATACLAVLLLEIVIDHSIGMPLWCRRGVLWGGGVLALSFILTRIVRPLVSPVNGTYAARAIEGANPTLHNSLINYLDLRKQRGVVPRAILDAVEARAVKDLLEADVETAVDLRGLQRASYGLAGVVILLVVYAVVTNRSMLDSFRRAFLADLPRPTVVQLRNLKAGSDPAHTDLGADGIRTFSVEVDGPRPDHVTLHYRAEGEAHEASVEFVPGRTSFDPWQATLPKIRQPIAYHVTAGDAVSRTYRLDFQPTAGRPGAKARSIETRPETRVENADLAKDEPGVQVELPRHPQPSVRRSGPITRERLARIQQAIEDHAVRRVAAVPSRPDRSTKPKPRGSDQVDAGPGQRRPRANGGGSVGGKSPVKTCEPGEVATRPSEPATSPRRPAQGGSSDHQTVSTKLTPPPRDGEASRDGNSPNSVERTHAGAVSRKKETSPTSRVMARSKGQTPITRPSQTKGLDDAGGVGIEARSPARRSEATTRQDKPTPGPFLQSRSLESPSNSANLAGKETTSTEPASSLQQKSTEGSLKPSSESARPATEPGSGAADARSSRQKSRKSPEPTGFDRSPQPGSPGPQQPPPMGGMPGKTPPGLPSGNPGPAGEKPSEVPHDNSSSAGKNRSNPSSPPASRARMGQAPPRPRADRSVQAERRSNPKRQRSGRMTTSGVGGASGSAMAGASAGAGSKPRAGAGSARSDALTGRGSLGVAKSAGELASSLARVGESQSLGEERLIAKANRRDRQATAFRFPHTGTSNGKNRPEGLSKSEEGWSHRSTGGLGGEASARGLAPVFENDSFPASEWESAHAGDQPQVRAAHVVERLKEILRNDEVSPELDEVSPELLEAVGVHSVMELEQFVTSLNLDLMSRVDPGPGRLIEVVPGISGPSLVSRSFVDRGRSKPAPAASQRAGAVREDELRGNHEGTRFLVPPELRAGFDAYRTSLSRPTRDTR